MDDVKLILMEESLWMGAKKSWVDEFVDPPEEMYTWFEQDHKFLLCFCKIPEQHMQVKLQFITINSE